MELRELTAEMLRLSRLLDDGLGFLKRCAEEYAEAEDAYHRARSIALLDAEGTVEEKKAHAALKASETHRKALLADGMRTAALEAVRSRRSQLSALQSVAAAMRSEMEMSRYGPEDSP